MAEVIIVGSAAEAGALVADEIVRLIRANPETVLGLATGSTPLPVYEALRPRLSGVDVSGVRGFALDEYVGIDAQHPQSYRSVLTREVVEPLGLDPSRVRVPDGAADGIEHAGDDYERALHDAGGVDMQLLGIGTDGHIGFNEPGSSFASLTRVKTLTAQTRQEQRPILPPDGFGAGGRRRRAAALHHAGPRHHPACAPPRAAGVRGGQGGGGRGGRGRPGDGIAAGVGGAAASARHGRRR